MSSNESMVVVTEDSCNACGTHRVDVHHQSFPEMRVRGESGQQAAENLITRLESNLDAVSDPSHREPVRLAIADVRAFLNRETVSQPKLSEVIDVRIGGAVTSAATPSMLAKTASLEVRRLTLAKDQQIPTHQARGEITVHCLDPHFPDEPRWYGMRFAPDP